MRRCQEELGQRIDVRGIRVARRRPIEAALPVPTEVGAFAKTLGTSALDTADAVASIEPRATHRKPKRRYKTRIRMPSMLDPHLATIEGWLAAEPQITALSIVGRLGEIAPTTFSETQLSIVQRLLRSLRRKAAATALAATTAVPASTAACVQPGPVDGAACGGHSAQPTGPPSEPAVRRMRRRSAHASPTAPG